MFFFHLCIHRIYEYLLSVSINYTQNADTFQHGSAQMIETLYITINMGTCARKTRYEITSANTSVNVTKFFWGLLLKLPGFIYLEYFAIVSFLVLCFAELC